MIRLTLILAWCAVLQATCALRAEATDCGNRVSIVEGELESVGHALKVDVEQLPKYLSQLETAISSAKIWCKDDPAEMQLLQQRERMVMDMRATLKGVKQSPEVQEKAKSDADLMSKCVGINDALAIPLNAATQAKDRGDTAGTLKHLKDFCGIAREHLTLCANAPRVMADLKRIDAGCGKRIPELEAQLKQKR